MNGVNKHRVYDLEDRLIGFAVRVMEVVEALPHTRSGNHVAGQLIRCGTSPAANYGEAQSAESRSDFVHKMKICLKELRESRIWIRISEHRGLIKPPARLAGILRECSELIAIFASSIKTIEKGREKHDTSRQAS